MKKLLIIPFLYISISGCSPKIQRTVKVTNNIKSTSTLISPSPRISGGFSDEKRNRYQANKKSLIKECRKISVRQKNLDEALERGAKVITSQEWEGAVDFSIYLYRDSVDQPLKKYEHKVSGVCYGFSYIIEGKKSVLDKYTPRK